MVTVDPGNDREAAEAVPLERRPGIFLIGSPNVGKRTILSRLLSIDVDETQDLSNGVLCHGWNIDTKYYSADVSVWTAQLDDDFSLESIPAAKQMVALVLVFDLSDLESFVSLQHWVTHIDIQRFEIIVCIGNKADLLPGHFAHAEYRRQLQKREESSYDPHLEFSGYGIHETEGTSLLGNEEPSLDMRKSCLEWCIRNNIEYVEACGSNSEFDKCKSSSQIYYTSSVRGKFICRIRESTRLSINGDMQGLDRLYGALSAHMWPGMVLKSGNMIAEPNLVDKEEESDEESDIELEYEILSGGLDDPWDDNNVSWTAFTDARAESGLGEDSSDASSQIRISEIGEPSASGKSSLADDLIQKHSEDDGVSLVNREVGEKSEVFPGITEQKDSVESMRQADESKQDTHLEYDELEHLMSEIGNMRGNLRLMPDFQRREMAANLAMKMAAMFGCSSEEEGFE